MGQINKILYTNGILTESDAALKTAQEIRQIAQIDTEVLHNGSTPLSTVGTIGKHVLCGIVDLGMYAFGSGEKQHLKDGIGEFGKAFQVWAKIQSKKSVHATELAGRVQAHLDADPESKILLVFHSQGAHIGLQALSKLSKYKDRIEVLSMGGMVRIPEYLASRVTNVSNSNDPVSNLIAAVLSGGHSLVDLGKNHTTSPLGHYASEYLNHPHTHDILKGKTAAPAA